MRKKKYVVSVDEEQLVALGYERPHYVMSNEDMSMIHDHLQKMRKGSDVTKHVNAVASVLARCMDVYNGGPWENKAVGPKIGITVDLTEDQWHEVIAGVKDGGLAAYLRWKAGEVGVKT